MKKSALILQQRAQKIDAQKALHAKAEGEKRSFDETETLEFRSLQTDIEKLTGDYNDALAFEANLRSVGEGGESVLRVENPVPEERKEVFSIHRAIRSQMVNGGVLLAGPELEMHKRATESALASGKPIGGVGIEIRAMQTVTGDSGAKGGNLVSTDLQSPIDFLRPEPLMRKIGATYIAGLTGNLRFPKNSGGIVASWEGETTKTSETANAYGYLDSIPKRLSVTVPISLQNLMQSNIDLEMYTINEMKSAIENAIDAASINGSGVGQPQGILNNSDVNTVATGANGSAPTWDMVVDAETSIFVSNASAAKMSYVVNPQTRGKLKKTKHEAGDLNYIMGTDGNVNGFPSVASNHVPANLGKGTGTNLSALIFGDFSQLNIHQWSFMDISVDEFSRKKEGLIEVTINIFLDVMLKQAKAFSVAKGIITT